MNTADPLSNLRGIHPPGAINWWPPAPGWWLLALILLVVVAAACHYLFRHIRRNRYRSDALQELRRLNENLTGLGKRDILEQIAILLRRVAIQRCGREEVAPLTGETWLRFLDSKGKTDQFTSGPGKVLAEGHYRKTFETDLDQLFPLVDKWIRGKHRC